MDPLPPIPAPPGEGWRTFKRIYIPIATFVLSLIAFIYCWKQMVDPMQ